MPKAICSAEYDRGCLLCYKRLILSFAATDDRRLPTRLETTGCLPGYTIDPVLSPVKHPRGCLPGQRRPMPRLPPQPQVTCSAKYDPGCLLFYKRLSLSFFAKSGRG